MSQTGESTASARQPGNSAAGAPAADIPLVGVASAMFLIFVGFSSGQFHSYLFESRGIQGLQIGLIIMSGQGVGILSPLFQVAIIRRFHGPRPPLMLMLAGAGSALAVLPRLHGFWPLLICFCVFSFCGAGVFPLNAACAFESMRAHGHGAFFRIRSLGTVGFLVGCVASVFFPDLGDLPLLYAGFAFALFCALAVVAWEYRPAFLPGGARDRDGIPVRGGSRPGFLAALRLLGEPRTLRLLILLGVMNFANSMATGVQGNYLVDRWHEGQRTISLAWVVSTGFEVPLMLLCAAVLRRLGLRYVIGFGILGTLLKLVGVAAAGEVWQYCLALTLHGCFFSGALTGFSVFLDRNYKREDRASLQALAPVFYAGIPASLAGLTAGLLWHAFSLRAVFLVSGGIALAAGVYALFLVRSGARIRPIPGK